MILSFAIFFNVVETGRGKTNIRSSWRETLAFIERPMTRKMSIVTLSFDCYVTLPSLAHQGGVLGKRRPIQTAWIRSVKRTAQCPCLVRLRTCNEGLSRKLARTSRRDFSTQNAETSSGALFVAAATAYGEERWEGTTTLFRNVSCDFLENPHFLLRGRR